jgi:nickel/cobalt transporter (NiCoT) family protein
MADTISKAYTCTYVVWDDANRETMINLLKKLIDERGSTKAKVMSINSGLIIFNLGAWGWAFLAFRHYPVLLGSAFLAYGFGLRHAVDADHIAAIDNVTRKLMQDGKRPVTVGLMFSLGHSTVVVVGSIAIAATTLAMHHRLDGFRDIGGLIGTLISTAFLFVIAGINLIVFRSIYQAFQRVRRGAPYVEEDFDMLIGSRGLLARLFRPMFRLIRSSWHMYPLGLLFGSWIRYCNRNRLARHFGGRSLQGIVLVLDSCLSSSFRCGNDTH